LFSGNSKIVRWILLVIFLLSSGLGLKLFTLETYQISSAAGSQLLGPQSEHTPFSSATIGGFGILGDSGSDEYRADDQRGGEYGAVTLNWMEQLVLKRGLNFGTRGQWDEPRRTGYKYNWARTGATVEKMIMSGQHTGLAEQVANGEVSHVFIWIGSNDFTFWNGTYQEIYQGQLSEAELQAKIDGLIANITLAVDTLLNAGDVQIIMMTIGDIGILPDRNGEYLDPAKRQRVSRAIEQVNEGLERLAEARGIGLVNTTEAVSALLTRIDKNGRLTVGGIPIKYGEKSDDPHYMWLGDSVGHAGTVASGLLANLMFVEPFNKKYELNLAPLSDQEILEVAGLTPALGWSRYLGIACLCIALVSAFVLVKQGKFAS
jgi:hypothetical protein